MEERVRRNLRELRVKLAYNNEVAEFFREQLLTNPDPVTLVRWENELTDLAIQRKWYLDRMEYLTGMLS